MAESAPLRILIVSTPKTGNSWLEALLAEIYNLPEASALAHSLGFPLPYEFDRDPYDRLGDSWIMFRHLWPTRAWLDWIRERGVVLLTTVRHPGDVLVSARQFVKDYSPAQKENPNGYEMLRDGDAMGEHTLRFVREHFYKDLNISILWAGAGARVVRFEDQVADPVKAMTAITDAISPVPAGRILDSVLLCELKRLRANNPARAFLFRRGRTGDWRETLPKAISETFRSQPPYPAQFAALGYDMDEAAAVPAHAFSYEAVDPFRGALEFDNGVPIPVIAIRLYLLHLSRSRERWPEPSVAAGKNCYFDWLNAECGADGGAAEPVRVTNLANEIYKLRPDLQQQIPDHLAGSRFEFVQWFLMYAVDEYKLPPAFLLPVFESAAVALAGGKGARSARKVAKRAKSS